jgi:hypothetical protein
MWIVMELMCYGSLKDVMIITDQTFNEHQVATVCQQVLLGVCNLIFRAFVLHLFTFRSST